MYPKTYAINTDDTYMASEIVSELIIDTIPINKYPACAIELYPNIRFILLWRIANIFPINIVKTDIIAKDMPISGQFNVLFHVVFETSLTSKILNNILSNIASPADLLATDKNIVIGVGAPS